MENKQDILDKLLPKLSLDSELSTYDVNDIDLNPAEHSLMLKKLKNATQKNNPSIKIQRTQIANNFSDHGIASTQKISLSDLVSKVTPLKRVVNNMEMSRPINDQQVLSVNQRKKTERQALYERAKGEVNLWQSTVDQNRKADQIIYPLEHVVGRKERTDLYKAIKCETKMEKDIRSVLTGNGDTVTSALALTENERKVLKAMDVETAQKMQGEFARLRSLQARYEKKARWARKIKSKSYRRMNRNEKRKAEEKSLERLKDENPEEFSLRVMRLKSDRREERMTLKHSASTKYAHNQKMYAKYNESAREFMQQMRGTKRQLVDKTPICEDDQADMHRCLDESDIYRPVLQTQQRDEEWEAEDHTLAHKEVTFQEQVEDIPIVTMSAGDFTLDRSVPDVGGSVPSMNYDDIAGGVTQGVDFMEEFNEEKKQVEDEEKERDSETFLPGWNSWAGPSIKNNKKRISQYTRVARDTKRSDSGLGNVIISTNQPTLSSHRVKHVPFPFLNVGQFESSIRTPIDRTWVPESVFKKMIKSRVVTKTGTIIKPICKKAVRPNRS